MGSGAQLSSAEGWGAATKLQESLRDAAPQRCRRSSGRSALGCEGSGDSALTHIREVQGTEPTVCAHNSCRQLEDRKYRLTKTKKGPSRRGGGGSLGGVGGGGGKWVGWEFLSLKIQVTSNGLSFFHWD